MAPEVTPEAAYISDTLYHFLPNDFRIFTEIVKKGLLCSVGNKGKLERFEVTVTTGVVESFDIWQYPA